MPYPNNPMVDEDNLNLNSSLISLPNQTEHTNQTFNGDEVIMATFLAPINIALIKYWGKFDEKDNVPLNDSLSLTLDTADLASHTTVATSPSFDHDRVWLNGSEISIPETPRLVKLFDLFRSMTKVDTSGELLLQLEDGEQPPPATKKCRPEAIAGRGWKFHVCSNNNFPTAAGLASSASGYAGLTLALAAITGSLSSYGCFSRIGPSLSLFTAGVAAKEPLATDVSEIISVPELENLSKLARIGSGSACRSLFGSFVRWNAGISTDDSFASPVSISPAPGFFDKDLRVLILVVNGSRKAVGSTRGMALSVATSPLLKYRVSDVVPARMRAMVTCLNAAPASPVARVKRGGGDAVSGIDSIRDRAFSDWCRLVMSDSDQLHAVCRDTYPPIAYMTDASEAVVRLVHAYNRHHSVVSGNGLVVLDSVNGDDGSGRSGDETRTGQIINRVAYSFDAGPNAFVFLRHRDVTPFLTALLHYFPSSDLRTKCHVIMNSPSPPTDEGSTPLATELSRTLPEMYESLGAGLAPMPNAISDVIYTRPGTGPKFLPNFGNALLDAKGYPIEPTKNLS